MIALDTNLLLFAQRAQSERHQEAVAAIRSASRSGMGWGLSFPVVGEFWCVVTSPSLPGGASPVAEAAAFLDDLFAAGAACWLPRAGIERRLVDLARSLQISGLRIFDLQIAMVAREAGATQIWTHDRRFIEIPGLMRLDPFEAEAR